MCVYESSSDRVVEVVGDDGHGHGDEHDAREGAAHADETAARRRRIEVACPHTEIGRRRGYRVQRDGGREEERRMPILQSSAVSIQSLRISLVCISLGIVYR